MGDAFEGRRAIGLIEAVAQVAVLFETLAHRVGIRPWPGTWTGFCFPTSDLETALDDVAQEVLLARPESLKASLPAFNGVTLGEAFEGVGAVVVVQAVAEVASVFETFGHVVGIGPGTRSRTRP